MLLIPQLYIRSKKVVALEGTRSSLYDENPMVMCQRIRDAGSDTVYIIDLGMQTSGPGENASIIQDIKKDGLDVYIGDGFKSSKAIGAYLEMGLKAAVLDASAYQRPDFVKEACSNFPGRIAVKIFVQGGKVTIPGWAVSPNKTAFDYAKQFAGMGIKLFFYSDLKDDGSLGVENMMNILAFCKKIKATVVCTSEINGSKDLERLVTLGAPGLEGLILARALYQNKIDLMAAIEQVSDLSIAPGNEPTLTDSED